jgi:hypothetical protein
MGGVKGIIVVPPPSTRKGAQVQVSIGGLDITMKFRDIQRCAQARPPKLAPTVQRQEVAAEQQQGRGKTRKEKQRAMAVARGGDSGAHDDSGVPPCMVVCEQCRAM